MLTAIKSANGFALAAAAAAAATLCALYPTLPLSPSLLLPLPLRTAYRIYECNSIVIPGRDVARKAATAPKNFKMAATGECGNALPVSLSPSPHSFSLSLPLSHSPPFAVPAQKDVRSILWFCKRLSHRILFALHIGHTPRPPGAVLLPSARTFRSPAWRWLPPAAPSTCVALQHN